MPIPIDPTGIVEELAREMLVTHPFKLAALVHFLATAGSRSLPGQPGPELRGQDRISYTSASNTQNRASPAICVGLSCELGTADTEAARFGAEIVGI
jgi:hypothetical protein